MYHDFLPPPSRGSHVNSDNTNTIINIDPLAHILDTWALIFSSCALLTVYPNRIMSRHPSPLHVITTRAWEGGPKEHKAKQRWPRETHCYICTRAISPFFASFVLHPRTLKTPIFRDWEGFTLPSLLSLSWHLGGVKYGGEGSYPPRSAPTQSPLTTRAGEPVAVDSSL